MDFFFHQLLWGTRYRTWLLAAGTTSLEARKAPETIECSGDTAPEEPIQTLPSGGVTEVNLFGKILQQKLTKNTNDPNAERRKTMKALKKHPIFRGVAVIVMALMTLTTTAPVARAASHREAPLIALDPAADNTDTYMFRSWQDPSKVVFIMNVIPGQDPADGPNYFNFDDDVVYRFNIDNDQDGSAEDIIYEFRFKTENRPIFGQLEFPLAYVGNPNIPVAELQGITSLDGPGSEGLTRRQIYTVTEMRGKQRRELFRGRKLVAVPSNVGPATFKNYEDLASQGIYTDSAQGRQ